MASLQRRHCLEKHNKRQVLLSLLLFFSGPVILPDCTGLACVRHPKPDKKPGSVSDNLTDCEALQPQSPTKFPTCKIGFLPIVENFQPYTLEIELLDNAVLIIMGWF